MELKRQRDRLRKYKVKALKVIEREAEIAKELIKRGEKKRALLTLRKKKYQQGLLEKTEGQILNLEEMVNSIDFADMQQKVFAALKVGKDSLETINSQMSLEEVEQLMDDSAEAIAYQQEIDEMLGGALSVEDDEAVLKELEALESFEALEEEGKEEKVAQEVSALPTAEKTVQHDNDTRREKSAPIAKKDKKPAKVVVV